MVRKTMLSAACAAAILALSAGAVSAGELTGNRESLKPLHANSECAFSGLDEEGTFDEDAPFFFGRTQSWGQLPKETKEAFTAAGVSPGIACNGHLHPYDGGGD
jgi:hypothetical protein